MIFALTIIMTVVGLVSAYVHVKTQEKQILEAMIIGADQLSGSIASATWHAMNADQREAAYQIMQTIAQKQGIDRIRIFNKEGRVMFSTMASDTGQVDKDAEACSMCHASMRPLVKVDVPSRARVYRLPGGDRYLGMITPIYNEPSCSQADCHAHPKSQSVLGVLDVTLELKRLDAEVAGIRMRVTAISIAVVLLMSIFTIYFTRHLIDDPIRKLIAWTRKISVMELDTPIAIDSSEELGELARSFDMMRVRLRTAMQELNALTQVLESKVEKRTEQLRMAHQKLLQTDRLASLGQLAASVAHEINNPLSGVLNLSMLMQRIAKDGGIPPGRMEEYRKYQSQVINETARVGRIVQDLLAFSRRSKPQQTNVNLNALVERTLNLLIHKLKLMGVEVELRLDGSLPFVRCDASQIQQVLVNIFMNGAEAAHGKDNGRLIVTTRRGTEPEDILIIVEDNGEGIPADIREKIFEPFFTTKGEGKGVGLGLAVVYGIVDAHKGNIEFTSMPGKGTIFTVSLPSGESVANAVDAAAAVGG
jgi:two-component system NtrC family sensor kinase